MEHLAIKKLFFRPRRDDALGTRVVVLRSSPSGTSNFTTARLSWATPLVSNVAMAAGPSDFAEVTLRGEGAVEIAEGAEASGVEDCDDLILIRVPPGFDAASLDGVMLAEGAAEAPVGDGHFAVRPLPLCEVASFAAAFPSREHGRWVTRGSISACYSACMRLPSAAGERGGPAELPPVPQLQGLRQRNLPRFGPTNGAATVSAASTSSDASSAQPQSCSAAAAPQTAGDAAVAAAEPQSPKKKKRKRSEEGDAASEQKAAKKAAKKAKREAKERGGETMGEKGATDDDEEKKKKKEKKKAKKDKRDKEARRQA